MKSTSLEIGGQRTDRTTATLRASTSGEAEFCDSDGAFTRFGLGRPLLYELLNLGLIKGCSLRRHGALRGKRLWSIESIRGYLESQMDGGGHERSS